MNGGNFIELHRTGLLTCQADPLVLNFSDFHFLDKARPGATVGATAQILRRVVLAGLTDKGCFFLSDDDFLL
ncbi:hypothetical protein T15_2101 [Streptococcus suis T15]|nr:hypothetical protein T15_2101 [Streptococcus suis T15]